MDNIAIYEVDVKFKGFNVLEWSGKFFQIEVNDLNLCFVRSAQETDFKSETFFGNAKYH